MERGAVFGFLLRLYDCQRLRFRFYKNSSVEGTGTKQSSWQYLSSDEYLTKLAIKG